MKPWLVTDDDAAMLKAASGCEAFSHWDPTTESGMTINVEALRQHAERGGQGVEPVTVPVSGAFVSHLLAAGTVTWAHAADLPFAVLGRRSLVCEQEDGTHILVDGNHRMVRWYGHGVRWAPAYVIRPEVWRRFVLPVPPEYSKARAGY